MSERILSILVKKHRVSNSNSALDHELLTGHRMCWVIEKY